MKIMRLESIFCRCCKPRERHTLRSVPADVLPVPIPRFAGPTLRRNRMKWEKPAATDMRLGFEITMYIANR
jgi:coenzyme PQQ precursor peptide PqqA